MTVYVYGQFAMKRDATGKFVSNWESEAKQRVNLSLTRTAWQLLDQAAQQQKVSKSELIEAYARSLVEANDRVEPGRSVEAPLPEAASSTAPKDSCQIQQQSHVLNAILTASVDHIYVFDRLGRYQYVSQGGAAVLGYQPEQLRNKTWRDLRLPAELMAQVDREREQVMATGQPLKAETEFTSNDGQRYYEYVLTPWRDRDQTTQGVIAISRDITERKQAEADLRQSKAHLQNALQKLTFHFENTPLAVIERDHNFLITRWSRSAERVFGWTANEVMGKDLQAVYEEDLEAVKAVRSRLINGIETHNVSSNRTYRKDRTLVHCEWYNSALLDEAGNLVSILSLILDVTQRQQTEAERDRLLKLEQAARAEAEAANRIKDEFLAVLSHELRSPLNPILGWVRLLRTRQFDAVATDRALETIERNAKLQTQLIEDLLDVSRILQGKMALNIQPLRLETVIGAALETVQLAAEAKQIQIQTRMAIEGRLVAGDASRLQQVMWNLLSNAVKFTPSGGQIEICLERIGTEAQIQVKDTGKGINADFLPYVFDYFRQEDGKTTRKFGGLGLGLAIVRHITELHGGTVTAASPGEGQGATFTIRLPLLQQEPHPIKTISHFSPDNETLTPLVGLRILVVDDEADMRDLMAIILQQAGAIVNTVSSATAALLAFDSFHPNVLISDIAMPEIDGYALIQQIRSRSPQAGGTIPAIALTAYAGELNQKQALAAGFQYHLAKPIEPETLIRVVVDLAQQDQEHGSSGNCF